MLKKLLTLLMIASPLLAQNARKDDIAVVAVTQATSLGNVTMLQPVGGALITIGQGDNTCTITGGVASCSPLASICVSASDVICSQSNPTNADANGNYGFWLKPGRYTVAITSLGTSGRVIVYDLSVGINDSTGAVVAGQFQSTVTTGTPPFVVASTTPVPNLTVAFASTATTATNVAGPGSITGTFTGTPTLAALIVGSLTDSGLTPGNCVQAGALGVLTTVAGACSASGGAVTVTGSPSLGQIAVFTGATSISNDAATPFAQCSGNNFAVGILASGNGNCSQPAFSNLSGNISTSQMNSGTGASASTFFRGDGTWASASGISVTAVNLTGLGANIGATTILTPGANGFYRMSVYEVLTQAATSSSTMPSVGMTYTDADSGVSEGPFYLVAVYTGNVLGQPGICNAISSPCQYLFYAKSGSPITYQTTSYASSGATSMQYALHIRLEGPF